MTRSDKDEEGDGHHGKQKIRPHAPFYPLGYRIIFFDRHSGPAAFCAERLQIRCAIFSSGTLVVAIAAKAFGPSPRAFLFVG